MNDRNNKIVFWGCFIALITTSFAFFSRMYLCGTRFSTEFGLDETEVGELMGAGIWPFGISIILFSLVIDKIGYRVAMLFSFVCYAVYLVMAPFKVLKERHSQRLRLVAIHFFTGGVLFSHLVTEL